MVYFFQDQLTKDFLNSKAVLHIKSNIRQLQWEPYHCWLSSLFQNMHHPAAKPKKAFIGISWCITNIRDTWETRESPISRLFSFLWLMGYVYVCVCVFRDKVDFYLTVSINILLSSDFATAKTSFLRIVH